MTDTSFIGISLIVANIVFSYKGLTNEFFFERYKLEVDRILINKDYKRLVSSGFLHVSWTHLIFNMVSLYSFSSLLETSLGALPYTIIYFSSLVGGNLFSLFIHRNHGDYSCVGASGAVCGIIFASIALYPGFGIGFFGIPIHIPGWLFGILFVVISFYGIKSKKDNIGHEAHLGGALLGMIVALLIHPSAIIDNYPTILAILIPSLLFIWLIITRPYILFIDNYYFKTHPQYYSLDQKYNKERNDSQQEIDRILDKISKKGMKSLTKNEKEALRQHSKKIR